MNESLIWIGQIKRRLKKEALFGAAIGVSMFSTLVGLQSTDFYSNLHVVTVLQFGIPLAVLFSVASIIHNFRIKAQSEKVKENVRNVCRAESGTIPGVSFHLRREEHVKIGSGSDGRSVTYTARVTYYLECSSATTVQSKRLSGRIDEATIPSTVPVAVAVGASIPLIIQSANRRLEGLENIKGLLTEEEYSNKRSDIIQEL